VCALTLHAPRLLRAFLRLEADARLAPHTPALSLRISLRDALARRPAPWRASPFAQSKLRPLASICCALVRRAVANSPLLSPLSLVVISFSAAVTSFPEVLIGFSPAGNVLAPEEPAMLALVFALGLAITPAAATALARRSLARRFALGIVARSVSFGAFARLASFWTFV
jgi:hypothetical protein